MGSLIRIISLLFEIASFLIVARAFSSWIFPYNPGSNPILDFLYQATEPILAPIRHFLGRHVNFQMQIDISPIVAVFLLLILRSLVIRLLTSIMITF